MSASAIKNLGDELNDRLPPFNLNIFIQYKRPEYMTHPNAAEWVSWNAPYYRFAIEAHQQKLLQQIAVAAHGRSAVVYASPAFSTNQDLFAHAEAGTIVENSNISDVALMAGHRRFSYGAAGHFGVGHSEPENIESEPLAGILRRGVDNEAMLFTQHMKDLDRLIRGSLEEDQSGRSLWEAARAAVRGGDVDAATGSVIDGSWLDAIDSIVAFGMAFDVRVTTMLVKADLEWAGDK